MIKNICLMFISVAFGLLLLEAGIRVDNYGWDSLIPHIMNSIHSRMSETGIVKRSENKEIIYELKPNLRQYYCKKKFSTNSQGLADKDYPLKKESYHFRVAVIGDSFTMPHGVPIENAYHSLLEERLGDDYPDKVIEFINFGVIGYDFQSYTAVIEHKVLAYEPDLILIGLGNNDLFEWTVRRKFRQGKVEFQPKDDYHPFLHWHSFDRLRNLFTSNRPISTLDIKEKNRRRRERMRRGMLFLDKMARRISEATVSKDIQVLIAHLAIRPIPKKRSQELKDLFNKYGMQYIDTTQVFKDKDKNDFIIFKADDHPNDKANEIFAEHIYPVVQEIIKVRTS